MHVANIKFPEKSDLETVLNFAKEFDYLSNHDKVVIDFIADPFMSPFSMLFIAAKIKSFREANPSIIVEAKNNPSTNYPAHMGFFQMFGVHCGRDIGEAWGNGNYIPITCLDRGSFYEAPGDKYQEFPDLIQRSADRIAEVISRQNSNNKNMFDVLSYSIREVMRNVFEHSGADNLYYCAQYWPISNKVEFALVYFGKGIRRGLGENPNFRFPTDKEAIEYALLPSVSGKTHLPRMSTTWFNSGYGLYMTSRLARNGGNFVLASGIKAIHLSRKTKHNYDTSFSGTALRFNMDVNQIGAVQDRLAEFRRDGEEVARTIAGSGNRPPSAMSLLLRRDYKRG
jgi:hypothetical protein